ncbi:MAG TPA: subclass B3 metallo-beta-lactamase [Sphingorhabdus sp.]|jgi:metallo-beta-lactamase class B|uniref:subclass B3 metallo-beta-lactamase n=1 Tax=Sphingorhabdus sp. TaxID=1902408 RepID=UPI002C7C16C3|nr:subclass B3 metallo-beta-lactamase [Sphingorhabdus sp.]HMT41192.1 subclass B3 metallo-beta-lactamase [Sphingorhabdus sp.]HMU21246.1 subclass B3 metallo-beta-lactamase [Sphingorhabdus sp.]
MFAKSVAALALIGTALTGCAANSGTQSAATAKFEPIAKACEGRDGWGDPAPPAHVYANVYMVGTCGIVSLLITTPQGHFLIDGAIPEAATEIAQNIRDLGFDPKDVRYLLNSHEHFDHSGGLAGLKRITGAKMVARAEAKDALESGTVHPLDPQRGLFDPVEGVKVDQIIRDGETLKIGNQVLTAIASPGHSPGGTSWRWQSCNNGKCLNIVFADSLSAVSADDYHFSDHPEYIAPLRATISKIASFETCDILITPHPSQSGFFERLNGDEPLIDATSCSQYAAGSLARLENRLAKEAAK